MHETRQKTFLLACACSKTEMGAGHKQLALLIYPAVCKEKEM